MVSTNQSESALDVLRATPEHLCGFAHENTDKAVPQECQVKCIACPHSDVLLRAIQEASDSQKIDSDEEMRMRAELHQLMVTLLRADLAAAGEYGSAIEHGTPGILSSDIRNTQKLVNAQLCAMKELLCR